MAKKTGQIQILQGAMKSLKINIKDAITTELQLTGQFDHLVANSLGIKDSLYDEKGVLRAGPRGWDLDLELYGAVLTIEATQGNLFTNKGLKIEAVQLNDASIIRLKEDEALRLKFKVIMAGVPPEELLSYVEGIKRGVVKISIDTGDEKQREKGKEKALQLGLVKAPEDNAGEEEEDENDKDESDETVEAAGENEPKDLSPAALASWREVNGKKPRVPRRELN